MTLRMFFLRSGLLENSPFLVNPDPQSLSYVIPKRVCSLQPGLPSHETRE